VPSHQPLVRQAENGDAAGVARLINLAFAVERFFVTGDRIAEADISARMTSGTFLVAERHDRSIAACVYTELRAERSGYIGLLAVDPECQGSGLGKLMMREAEQHCLRARCSEAVITVVNLRTELPPFYRSLGYRERGIAPFTDDRATKACHFIIMGKSLG
jgi:N-acetylglutamate synthase-like GNAT family acetyltransferase